MREQTHKNESGSMTGPVRAAVGEVQRKTGNLMDALVREGEKERQS
ncbi:MAG: hypothetical protein IPM89_01325 [Candidatus Competibacteraceae bacterium]|nr:MAG: hypothetical protein IPM89_01325 [Candidatus Competibacteraceae bacterium]